MKIEIFIIIFIIIFQVASFIFFYRYIKKLYQKLQNEKNRSAAMWESFIAYREVTEKEIKLLDNQIKDNKTQMYPIETYEKSSYEGQKGINLNQIRDSYFQGIMNTQFINPYYNPLQYGWCNCMNMYHY